REQGARRAKPSLRPRTRTANDCAHSRTGRRCQPPIGGGRDIGRRLIAWNAADDMWGDVTPAERLRAVTRRNVDEERLAIEAADALAAFASEPASLVVACRRVLAHHRSCGPLWWVCARILAAADPSAATRDA